MATYGEGDPTDNAQDFYDWLQENDDEDLSGLNYTVSLYHRGWGFFSQDSNEAGFLAFQVAHVVIP